MKIIFALTCMKIFGLKLKNHIKTWIYSCLYLVMKYGNGLINLLHKHISIQIVMIRPEHVDA